MQSAQRWAYSLAVTSFSLLGGPLEAADQHRSNLWAFVSGTAGLLIVLVGVIILLESRSGQADPSLIRWNQMLGFGAVLLGAVLSAACVAILGVRYEINRVMGRGDLGR